MQKQAGLQKQKISEAFEKMKAKGKMDPNIIERLGIGSNDNATTVAGSKY